MMTALAALLVELHVGVVDPRTLVDIRFVAPALGTFLDVVTDLCKFHRYEPCVLALGAFQQQGFMPDTILPVTDTLIAPLVTGRTLMQKSHIISLSA